MYTADITAEEKKRKNYFVSAKRPRGNFWHWNELDEKVNAQGKSRFSDYVRFL
jgi:hypothetical protein